MQNNNARLTAALEQVHAEGQGVWQLRILTPFNVPDLISDAANGDPMAANLYLLLGAAIKESCREHYLCLLCDYEFSPQKQPIALVVVSASRNDPRQAVVNGLCPACAGGDALLARVVDKYRDSMIPDLRLLPRPHQNAGHG